MAKISETLKKQVEEALKNGKPLPEGVSVNFGDPEPYQTAAEAKAAADKDK
ncbi:MAG: hypothetical protein ACR2OE_09495 [Thermomicrobiales bacterium]